LKAGPDADGWYNTPLEFIVIPEPAGRVHIAVNGQWQIVEQSTIIATGADGVLWPACQIRMRCEGGMYIWRAGTPLANPTGTLQLGRYVMGRYSDYLSLYAATDELVSENGGTITVNHDFEEEVYAHLKATLEPDATRRRFPFLYLIGVNIPAGPRTGAANAFVWDSDDHDSPILDIRPMLEAQHRRAEYSVTLRDVDTVTFAAAGANNSHLENQVPHLTIDGTSTVKAGLITEATASDAATPTAHRNSTEVTLKVCDGWARLDEDVMDDRPIGDGEWLSDYIINILANGGYHSSYETSELSTGLIRELPMSAGGEPPRFVPRDGITRGEYLRALLEEWGLGWMLYQDGNGKWQLVNPPTTPAVTFGGAGVRILRVLDLPRDISEFTNWIRVESEDRAGNPIADEFPLWKSINDSSDKSFVGRKIMETRQVAAARTAQDLYWVRRSIQARFSGLPRFHAFETEYVKGVFPGQYANMSGISCRIQSIPDGSTRDNRMSWLLQEVG
jgi:hypothetical protein